MSNLRQLLLATAFVAACAVVQPAQALFIDTSPSGDPNLSPCFDASSFTYDLVARPRELRWTCEDTGTPTEHECYITDSVLYFDDSKFLIAVCTTNIDEAPLPAPDTDLLNDSFEGGVVAANKRVGKMSVEAPLSLELRLCLPPDAQGISHADVTVLPASSQALAKTSEDYRAFLAAACASQSTSTAKSATSSFQAGQSAAAAQESL